MCPSPPFFFLFFAIATSNLSWSRDQLNFSPPLPDTTLHLPVTFSSNLTWIHDLRNLTRSWSSYVNVIRPPRLHQIKSECRLTLISDWCHLNNQVWLIFWMLLNLFKTFFTNTCISRFWLIIPLSLKSGKYLWSGLVEIFPHFSETGRLTCFLDVSPVREQACWLLPDCASGCRV